MSETEPELVDAVKKWIHNDEKIKELQKELKTLKNAKKEYTTNLVKLMDEKNFSVLNLNNDSKIIHKKNKVKSGLSKKLLTTSLANFFKEGDDLNNVIQFIMAQRPEKITDDIAIK